MKFTDNQFVEAVELLQALKPKSRRNDKRRSLRREIRLPIRIKTNGADVAGPWQVVQLRDLSARGIRLLVPAPMSVGSSFLVLLPTKGNKDDSPLICRVVYAVKEKDAEFSVGAEFIGRQELTPPPAASAEELERIQRSILG